jgi:hypothetical protein
MTDTAVLVRQPTRDAFLEHVWDMIAYWEDEQAVTPEGRLRGLAFSILNALDGNATELPGYSVRPLSGNRKDIAGGLHEVFYTLDHPANHSPRKRR